MIDYILIGLVVFQQVYWSRTTQKLIDKLMSRNYHEYKQAESPRVQERTKLGMEAPDDLGSLGDFQPL